MNLDREPVYRGFGTTVQILFLSAGYDCQLLEKKWGYSFL
jgi:hypothetical protein